MKGWIKCEDEQELLRAAKSLDLCAFMWDFQRYLRSQARYGDPPDDIGKIYERWFEELDNQNINLNDLYS